MNEIFHFPIVLQVPISVVNTQITYTYYKNYAQDVISFSRVIQHE